MKDSVPWCFTAPLSKVLNLVERELIAAQVEHRVEKHAAVASTQNKSVSIRPLWVLGVMLETVFAKAHTPWGLRPLEAQGALSWPFEWHPLRVF